MKRIMFVIMTLVLLLSSIPVVAAENKPVIYTDTITVTEDGGRYQVGFINVEFKKDFIDPAKLPATFEVKVYAENGVGYVEFAPDTPNFFKKVHIRIDKYDGLLYDQATGENIEVHVKKQQILAEHFSRYAFY
ncbi:hypothetical protein [Tepidibacillus sp. LV47]|uniref:hypothetical protein n=1 Tax=Tepidibacillus sp. LV47 TaxID=3398228 RepID=UPI003AB011B3